MRLNVLFASLALSMSVAPNVHADEELLVFVGALVDIREAPDPCKLDEGEDTLENAENEGDVGATPLRNLDCIRLDTVFHATYDVLEVLAGSTEHGRISFSVADHYGYPGFAEFKHSLLFVGTSEEEPWLHKYQGYAVLQTVEGRWASCGNPYDDRVGDDPRHLVPLSFANPLAIVGELSVHGLVRRFDERYVAVDGDRVECREGVYLEDLYKMVKDGVLSARGIDAPELRLSEL